MTDLLAQFRSPGTQPAAAPEMFDNEPQAAAIVPTGYRAFAVASATAKPPRLEVRAAKGLAFARPYSAIAEIAYDRDGYHGILLMFPQKLVTIQGRNLKPVVEALLAGTCEYVAQIGEAETAPHDAPVIEQITVGTPKPATQPGR